MPLGEVVSSFWEALNRAVMAQSELSTRQFGTFLFPQIVIIMAQSELSTRQYIVGMYTSDSTATEL